ncbi:MAG: polysaccharide deacetylase family protein [Candidatus Nitrosotenuis sp.]
MSKILFLIFVFTCVVVIPSAFAEEKTGSLDLFIKNENNDRVYPQSVSLKVYQDLGTKPIREIQSFEANPLTISPLPINHRYKIEVYMNSMYAGTNFIDMKKEKETLEITIKNTGGMQFSIFYNDGETPLQNAGVWIKSADGKPWSYSETDKDGKTIRVWLYPTIKEGDYYYVEVSLGPGLKYIEPTIKLQPNTAQDFKIITKWPKILDKLVTVEVYNNTKNKVTKQDGSFVVQLYDSQKNKIAESEVTNKGLAYFSKLKIGNYALYLKTKDDAGQPLAGKRVTITDSVNTLKIYLHNPELNSDNLNCNCVAFRLDDVQDFYLSQAQQAVISEFAQKDQPLTIGVIASVIGTDQNLVSLIKNGVADDSIEIANHSWRHGLYTKMKKAEQDADIKNSNKKIAELFGVTPTTFIPPQNLYNNDTISLLKSNGFTHMSHGEIGTVDDPPKFQKSSFYYFPMFAYTATLNVDTNRWEPQTNDQILERINDSIFNYGYAVVMMHPHEFSVLENGAYANKANTTKISELGALLDKVQSSGIKILPIKSIQDFDAAPQKSPTPEVQQKPNCNCVAFRLDNVQDFWLNDVQNTVLDTFDKNKVPLTITVIGKFTGDDPKAVNHIKEMLESKTQIRIGSRGWEYVDHTTYDQEKQKASISQTNEKIKKIFGKSSMIFSPPYDVFNKDTLAAAKDAKILYFSSSITKDPLPFQDDSIKHVPSTIAFSGLIDDDPFYSGTIPEKALAKIQASIKQNGFAVISLQPSDLAVKTDVFKNEVNSEKLQLLEMVLSELKSNQIRPVLLESIPDLTTNIVIPDWIKNNARWWSEGKIADSDFTKGIQYLIEQGVIKVPQTAKESSSAKIPDWIKNNARWWSEGKIADSDFTKGIQYLIQNGIIAA